MLCRGCNEPLSKYISFEICTDCRYDKNIIISRSSAIRKYKLTNEEINNAKLYSISFRVSGNYGTIYLIDNIENLAHNLTKNLDDNNKKKKAYIKQKLAREPYKKSKQITNERIKIITDDVNMLLAILDPDISVETFKNYDIRHEIISLAKNHDMNVMNASTIIYDILNSMYTRKNDLDKLIDDNIDEKYIRRMKLSRDYKDCINNAKESNVNSVNYYFENIKKSYIGLKNRKKNA